MQQFRLGSILVGAGLVAWALAAPLAGQKPRAAAPGGVHAGIQVHGHWTIVVRNKDGSVAARREFENSLQLDGVNLLAAVLGGFATPGGWQVVLASGEASTPGPCPATNQVHVFTPNGTSLTYRDPCFLAAAGVYSGGGFGCAYPGGANSGEYSCNTGLAVTLVSNGTAGASTMPLIALQLSGNVTVLGAGEIDTVGTMVSACTSASAAAGGNAAFILPASSSTVAPATCSGQSTGGYTSGSNGGNIGAFTGTSLAAAGVSPIAVVPQQTVQVTVVISFS